MKDPKTEQWLRHNNWNDFRFQAKVKFTDIDLAEAESNTARPFRKIEDDVALRYGIAMEAGIDFPAILLIEVPGYSKFLLASGRHRIKGAVAAGLDALDAYIVMLADPSKRTLLIHAANTTEGLAPQFNENLLLAAEAKRLCPETPNKEIAQAFFLKTEILADFLHQQVGEDRAQRLDVLGFFDSLKTQHLKLQLRRIQNDNLFVRAVKFASTHQLNGRESVEFCVDILKCRTEAAGFTLIDKLIDEYAKRDAIGEAKHARAPRAPWSVLISQCKPILRGPDESSLHLASVPVDMLPGTMTVIEETVDRLSRILRILKARAARKAA